MNKICLFALLVAAASANLAADMSGIQVSREILTCLAGKNVSKLVLQISDAKGTIKTDFVDGYIFANDAGISTVDAIVVVNDTLTASVLSGSVTATLHANFNGTIWLQVLDSDGLWTQQVDQRVAYLDNLVFAFRQHGLKVGVYSDAKTWASVFGGQRVGSDSLKAVPVWYVNGNGIQSFDDFSYAGFGTWTEASLKNFESYPHDCQTWITSLDFY